MSVTYNTTKVQPKLIGNGRSLTPVTFYICGNANHNVRYIHEFRTQSFI
jgi:CRISPR/Cas system CSM-associated protein Csm5 (group 7 of RAMP superfamily)